jgi:hypothetical protein
MDSYCRNILKLSLLAIVTVMLSFSAYAQKPVIKSIDRVSGANNDIITLTGSNFGTDPAALSVFFGAVKGTVEFASNQVIEVRVPPGATFDHVSVTNKANGLTAYSEDPFLLSFHGETGLESSQLEGARKISVLNQGFMICAPAISMGMAKPTLQQPQKTVAPSRC